MFAARSLSKASLMCHGRRHSTRRRHSLSSLKQPAWPSSPAPTPHEILGIQPGSAYSKASFNRLVKMYHPDMSSTDPRVEHLTEVVRLERYRLIVAAHNLLSNAHNRRLYESRGEGWSQRPSSQRDSYRQEPQDARPSPMQQRPLYTSNATFAILLLALGMLGAALQHRRLALSQSNARRLEAVLQEAIQAELEAWSSVLQGQSRDDRVVAFLARRQGVPRRLQDWVVAHGESIGSAS